MAEPSDRAAGSNHILKFHGKFIRDAATIAVYPKSQTSYPAGSLVGTLVPFRALLADSSDVANLLKQFPSFVLDDTIPAGEAPHAPVLGGATQGILNATDLNISARTWCQNIFLTVTPTDETDAGLLPVWDPAATRVCLDVGDDSGLGTDTGLPVLVFGGIFDSGEQNPPVNIDLDVVIEVRHSASR